MNEALGLGRSPLPLHSFSTIPSFELSVANCYSNKYGCDWEFYKNRLDVRIPLNIKTMHGRDLKHIVRPEPTTRGTCGLIISCVATLSLCVYTALHFNVVKSLRPSFVATTFKKVGWILVGMFAPELVVYTAWSQWVSARKLTDIVAKHFDRLVRTKTIHRRVGLTPLHSIQGESVTSTNGL